MKTLSEQIKEIHFKHFHKEFHEYRQNLIPAMVNDLAMKLFDDLVHDDFPGDSYWYIADSVDIQAVKVAKKLIQNCGLRENTPAVEWTQPQL